MGKTYKYRNVGGSHVLADGTEVASGQVFVSDDPNLSTTFANKFVAASEVPAAEAAPATPTPEKVPGEILSDDHVDVTEDFPEAVKRSMTVTKNKAGWWIYDNETEPINEKGLKKKDVDDAIIEYLPE